MVWLQVILLHSHILLHLLLHPHLLLHLHLLLHREPNPPPPPHLPRYPCEHLQDGVCSIKEVPFRGCNCTDAAGKEFPYSQVPLLLLPYSQVLDMLAMSEGGRGWDGASATPTFTYREGAQDFQVWYDDPQSLAIKYQVGGGIL